MAQAIKTEEHGASGSFAWDICGWSWYGGCKSSFKGMESRIIESYIAYKSVDTQESGIQIQRDAKGKACRIEYRSEGWLVGTLTIKGGKVLNVSVIPPYQRQGIGTALYSAAMAEGVDLAGKKNACKTISQAAYNCRQKLLASKS